jgi:circadian clock protein KaiC
MHLALIHKNLQQTKPAVAIFDPITNLLSAAGNTSDVNAMLTRLIDSLKARQITTLFTSLTSGEQSRESTDVGISSLMDTWILLRDLELNGERNRAIYILKSRGMKHSNQVREFVLTPRGIDLVDVYVGPAGVLTGSARLSQEASERAQRISREQETLRRLRGLERKRKVLEAQIASLRAEFDAEEDEVRRMSDQQRRTDATLDNDRNLMARNRFADLRTTVSRNGGGR